MNCNEEFVVRAVGKISLEFPITDQLKLRDILYESLYNFNVLPVEQGLVASDIEEKIMLYLACKKIEGKSDKTIKNYYGTLQKFASYVVKPITTVTIMDIRMYLATTTKELKPGTINTIMSTLKSFFSWLELEEYILKNPTRKLKPYKLPKRLRKSLTVEELERLRDSCKTIRERSILEWIFSTGCRLSEVINTNIEHLNFSDYSLRVVGKGNKEREVYFSPKAKLYLEKYLSTRKDCCPALFVSSRAPHQRLKSRAIEREINRIAERAGFDKAVFPHLLRHTMATLAVQSGAKLTTVQHLLGHDDASTTQIYAETSLEEVRLEYKQHLIQ